MVRHKVTVLIVVLLLKSLIIGFPRFEDELADSFQHSVTPKEINDISKVWFQETIFSRYRDAEWTAGSAPPLTPPSCVGAIKAPIYISSIAFRPSI